MTGRATSANLKTPWSGPARSRPARCSTWATCPRSSSNRGCNSDFKTGRPEPPASQETAPSMRTLAELERDAILSAIRTLNGDKLQAARLLGIGKTTLYRKLKEYGITDPVRES